MKKLALAQNASVRKNIVRDQNVTKHDHQRNSSQKRRLSVSQFDVPVPILLQPAVCLRISKHRSHQPLWFMSTHD